MSASTVEQTIPEHIAIIMDGNGRWAEQRRQPRLFGHKKGVDSVREVVETAREIGVRHLTLYAFSTENWRRPAMEVSGLMALLRNYLEQELANLLENDIRLCCFGQRDQLPGDVQRILDEVIANTAGCTSMTLNLALSYGSRAELLRAVREVAQEVLEGTLAPGAIDEPLFSARLYTAGQPDPDLLIRTGGERRLSNFLLWQASYSELYFTETQWPDFRRAQLLEAVDAFNRRQRRFGKTGAQLRGGSGG